MSRTPLLAIFRAFRTRRMGALLLALSFLLIGGGVPGGHDCAHHQWAVGTATSGQAPGPDGGHHGSHAGDLAVPVDDHDGHSAPCRCVGTCHGSAATPLAPAARAASAGLAPAGSVSAPGSPDALSVRLLPYVLPFANGPPARG